VRVDAPPAPFVRLGPWPPSPLICAVPHAGRNYPPALLRDSAVPQSMLAMLADAHADALVEQAVAAGARAVVARIARAWIDLNRAPHEVDPAMQPAGSVARPPGARVRGGLGLVPRRLGGRELLARLPSPDEVAARVATVHAPYHAAIADALADAVARHGFAVLLDCHSMPSLGGARAAQVVIGTRHGQAAGRAVAEAALRMAAAAGLRAALDAPYAGAHTIERHGRPIAGVQAVQVEVDRALYLDRAGRPVAAGVQRIAALIAAIGGAAVAAARPLAVAAE